MNWSFVFKVCISLPKTFWLNIKLFPIKKALKLPIWVSYNTMICVGKDSVVLPELITPFMIRVGFHECDECNPKNPTLLKVNGRLIFHGSAHIGRGSKICVGKGALLELGNNFAISASSCISCHKHIVLGDDIQFSWDCLVMDSDTHTIIGENGSRMNPDKEIVFGNKIWIGNGCMILKGTHIPNTCVIGARSVVSGSKFSDHSIIVGNPAKSVKAIGDFKI